MTLLRYIIQIANLCSISAITCAIPEPPENGLILDRDEETVITYGEYLLYGCQTGYATVGHRKSRCELSGQLSNRRPTCAGTNWSSLKSALCVCMLCCLFFIIFFIYLFFLVEQHDANAISACSRAL